MSDKPQETKKTKKRRSSDTAIRRFLTILISLIAVVMILMVIYELRHNTTDPGIAEGTTKERTTTETEAVTEPSEETEATEVTEPTEPVDPARVAAEQKLADMTLEEKVYQMFFVTNHELTGAYYESTAGENTRAALESKPVGGVVYDRDNIFSQDQLSAMIRDTQSYSAIPLLIGVEEEGGIEAYSYLRTIGVTTRSSEMGVYGDDYAKGIGMNRVNEIAAGFGKALTGVGFNIDLAPVADTLVNSFNPELGVSGGRRAFSDNKEITAELVRQMVDGLHDGGCMSCLKYFPGLSASNTDSRYGMAVSNQTGSEIRENLLAFTKGIENNEDESGKKHGADMIMVSHLCLPNIVGENRPADLCPEIVSKILREELGYDGVVITDSFEKYAIRSYYETGAAAVAAIRAGCDMIYMPNDLEAAAQAIIAAANDDAEFMERINKSVLRILMLKYENGLME